MAPVISMEMSLGCRGPGVTSTTPVPCYADDCIYANMGISRVESSSGSCFRFILSLSSPAPFFTASPHTWHAAHMKRAQPLLTLPPSLTFTLFLYFTFLLFNFCFHCINFCKALLNYHPVLPYCITVCARPGIEITGRAQ